MFQVIDTIKDSQADYRKLIVEYVEKEKIWTEWLQYVKGVGHLMTAVLLKYYSYCEGIVYPSQLTSYAGYKPENDKFKKGEEANYNPNLRKFCYRIADSFIKQRNKRYRSVYDEHKALQLQKMEEGRDDAPENKQHAHLRAIRKMMNKFLVDYYRVAKTITGEKQANPYVIEHTSHEDFDDVLVHIENLKKQKFKKEL